MLKRGLWCMILLKYCIYQKCYAEKKHLCCCWCNIDSLPTLNISLRYNLVCWNLGPVFVIELVERGGNLWRVTCANFQGGWYEYSPLCLLAAWIYLTNNISICFTVYLVIAKSAGIFYAHIDMAQCMKWKEFPGSLAGRLHGMWGTVSVRTAHVIDEGGK